MEKKKNSYCGIFSTSSNITRTLTFTERK